MKRQEELDFHSVNIRRGRHKSWIDLWRSNEIFQMISLTGMLVNYLIKNLQLFGLDRQTQYSEAKSPSASIQGQ